MASQHTTEVLGRMHALKLTALSDAQNHEGVDVVDLLPGPIWHIIFRHLLLPPPANSTQKRGNSLGALQQGARSTSFATTRPLSASEQHEENTRRFGSSWPLLRCAMSSKRLFEHVTSFSVSHPLRLLLPYISTPHYSCLHEPPSL
ncbi:unnamed protein product [Closterium sp. Naga37s-1]|nr:unnamed protein product [Closterium sp. Naga37s-1]